MLKEGVAHLIYISQVSVHYLLPVPVFPLYATIFHKIFPPEFK